MFCNRKIPLSTKRLNGSKPADSAYLQHFSLVTANLQKSFYTKTVLNKKQHKICELKIATKGLSDKTPDSSIVLTCRVVHPVATVLLKLMVANQGLEPRTCGL